MSKRELDKPVSKETFILIRKTNERALTHFWRSEIGDWLDWVEHRLENPSNDIPYEIGWWWRREISSP